MGRSRKEIKAGGRPKGVAEELKARAISSRLVRKPPNHRPSREAGAPLGPSLRAKM